MSMLPEGCVADVLSLTSPKDTCRLSLVSTTFRSASDSDAVWDKFLPSDYKDIVSQSGNATTGKSFSPPQFKSKKQQYLWLSDHPVIIDQGTKSFSIEKRSGKRCYMLGPRDLTIVWGDTPRYWRWTSVPDSRFGEVAELVSVCWLEIHGKININLLSTNTTYTAFFVFKLTSEAFGFEYKPAEVSVGVSGGVESETRKHTVCLDPHGGSQRRLHNRIVPRQRSSFLNRPHSRFYSRWNRRHFRGASRLNVEVKDDSDSENIQDVLQDEDEKKVEVEAEEGFYPKLRGDGWMEIELGDYNSNVNDNSNGPDQEDVNRELEMSLMEVKGGDWKGGLIVQGIEIRPKLTL